MSCPLWITSTMDHRLVYHAVVKCFDIKVGQICLKVEIDEKEGSATLDFEGTGCEVRGNLNAPISVVHSAVIYCMRAMLDVDIPLNAGCLVPLDSECFSVLPQHSRSVLWQFAFRVTAYCHHHALRQFVGV